MNFIEQFRNQLNFIDDDYFAWLAILQLLPKQ